MHKMIRKSLTEIANFHGTDKGTIGPSPEWGAHNYTDVYEAYLSRYRPCKLKILEIGIGVDGDRWSCSIAHGRNLEGGASLKMWYDYFPNAMIYGIDINSAHCLDNDRIRTLVANQGSVEDLQAFSQKVGDIQFDVIIDDGSHRPDHQQISLGFFFKRLKRGGLYFVEDLLANGRGDGVGGRHACSDVLNTREVLKRFQYSGDFAKPNALIDPMYLNDNIAYISFHVPKIRVRAKPVMRLTWPLKRTIECRTSIEFTTDAERLVVLRKK